MIRFLGDSTFFSNTYHKAATTAKLEALNQRFPHLAADGSGWGPLQSPEAGSTRRGSFNRPEEAGGVPVVLKAPGGLQDLEEPAALGQRQAPRQAQATPKAQSPPTPHVLRLQHAMLRRHDVKVH